MATAHVQPIPRENVHSPHIIATAANMIQWKSYFCTFAEQLKFNAFACHINTVYKFNKVCPVHFKIRSIPSSQTAVKCLSPIYRNSRLATKRPGREDDHSPETSTEVKKTWNYTSTLLYTFMAECLISQARGKLYFCTEVQILVKIHFFDKKILALIRVLHKTSSETLDA
jgi:hypothetical protein